MWPPPSVFHCLSYLAYCKGATCSLEACNAGGNSLKSRRKLPGRMEGGMLTKVGIKERNWALRELPNGNAGGGCKWIQDPSNRLAHCDPTVFYNWKHLGIFKRIFKQQNHHVSTFLVRKQIFYSNKLENMFNSGSTVPLVHKVQRTPWESSGTLEGKEVTNPLISLVRTEYFKHEKLSL